ncbi:hypothetical protein [Tardiphaga sp.]|uniref:hypothetical protein n=1 Tax=Tardiphaga sp. TaxID=1926292 RepID=UPI0037DA73DE
MNVVSDYRVNDGRKLPPQSSMNRQALGHPVRRFENGLHVNGRAECAIVHAHAAASREL